MLTLKPLNLQTANPMLTISASFHEKILSNYALLGANFQPKDLLFLMIAPPELPEDLGGVTNIALSSNVRNSRQVLLEVVNNVVNRILLSDRADFTYQDNVYITSVLQKLGITNVSEFMRQVKALQEENKSVFNLLQFYESHWKLLAKAGEPASKKPAAGGEPAETSPAGPGGARYYIHNEIYNRLGTAHIYELWRQLSTERSLTERVLSNRELRTAEQTRVAQDLRLAELKGRTVFRESVVLRHHLNRYELGDLLPIPTTEQEVLSAGAAAALLHVVDNVMVSRLESVLRRSDLWLDIRNAVFQSAENSLSRFEYYLSHADIRQLRREANYAEELNKLFQDETEVLNRLSAAFTREGDKLYILPPGESPPAPPLTLEHRTTQESREETVLTVEGEEKQAAPPKEILLEATRSVLERMIAPQPPAVGRPAIPPPPGAQPLPGAEERLELQYHTETETETRTETEATQRLTERETEVRTRGPETRPGEPVDILRGTLLSKETRESVLREQARRPEEGPAEAGAASPTLVLENRAGDLYETTEEAQRLARETVEKTETLKKQLDELNLRNKELYERYQAERLESIRERLTVPDRKRAFADALRAIGEPEQVIAEFMAAPAPAELEHKRPQIVETLLSRMDEKTRQIMESVLLYQENPQAALERGLLRPAGVGVFNADAAAAAQAREAVELTHPSPEQEEGPEAETAQTGVLERYRESRTVIEEPVTWSRLPKAPTVFRQTETGFSEEFLERLESRRTQDVRKVEETETVTKETVTQTEVNNLRQELVRSTTEDITELVNRAIARQIGSLTDRVYSQMERRLETERARRGRF